MSTVNEILEQRGQDGASLKLTDGQLFFLSKALPGLYQGKTEWADGEGIRVQRDFGTMARTYTITLLKDRT